MEAQSAQRWKLFFFCKCCLKHLVFKVLFSSHSSPPQFLTMASFLIQRDYSHGPCMQKSGRRIEHKKSNLYRLHLSALHPISFFLCADVNHTDHSTPFQERPASNPFKYAMINGGAAYLDVSVTFLSMWVCMSGGAYIYECLWVSVFKLFMRLKCSSGTPCNTLWK